MTKIKFTSGTIQKTSSEYYTLNLFDAAGNTVYKASLPALDAAAIIDKYNNNKIRLVK